MTRDQYLNALSQLGLSSSARATALALGLSVRQCQRLAAGHSPVPEPVAILLGVYLREAWRVTLAQPPSDGGDERASTQVMG